MAFDTGEVLAEEPEDPLDEVEFAEGDECGLREIDRQRLQWKTFT